MTKKVHTSYLNQNSREPGTEPEEMIPLWKILHMVGADWTYPSKGWAAENYCMFLADDDGWKHLTKMALDQAVELGCKVLRQHRVRSHHVRCPGRTAKI